MIRTERVHKGLLHRVGDLLTSEARVKGGLGWVFGDSRGDLDEHGRRGETASETRGVESHLRRAHDEGCTSTRQNVHADGEAEGPADTRQVQVERVDHGVVEGGGQEQRERDRQCLGKLVVKRDVRVAMVMAMLMLTLDADVVGPALSMCTRLARHEMQRRWWDGANKSISVRRAPARRSVRRCCELDAAADPRGAHDLGSYKKIAGRCFRYET